MRSSVNSRSNVNLFLEGAKCARAIFRDVANLLADNIPHNSKGSVLPYVAKGFQSHLFTEVRNAWYKNKDFQFRAGLINGFFDACSASNLPSVTQKLQQESFKRFGFGVSAGNLRSDAFNPQQMNKVIGDIASSCNDVRRSMLSYAPVTMFYVKGGNVKEVVKECLLPAIDSVFNNCEGELNSFLRSNGQNDLGRSVASLMDSILDIVNDNDIVRDKPFVVTKDLSKVITSLKLICHQIGVKNIDIKSGDAANVLNAFIRGLGPILQSKTSQYKGVAVCAVSLAKRLVNSVNGTVVHNLRGKDGIYVNPDVFSNILYGVGDLVGSVCGLKYDIKEESKVQLNKCYTSYAAVVDIREKCNRISKIDTLDRDAIRKELLKLSGIENINMYKLLHLKYELKQKGGGYSNTEVERLKREVALIEDALTYRYKKLFRSERMINILNNGDSSLSHLDRLCQIREARLESANDSSEGIINEIQCFNRILDLQSSSKILFDWNGLQAGTDSVTESLTGFISKYNILLKDLRAAGTALHGGYCPAFPSVQIGSVSSSLDVMRYKIVEDKKLYSQKFLYLGLNKGDALELADYVLKKATAFTELDNQQRSIVFGAIVRYLGSKGYDGKVANKIATIALDEMNVSANRIIIQKNMPLPTLEDIVAEDIASEDTSKICAETLEVLTSCILSALGDVMTRLTPEEERMLLDVQRKEVEMQIKNGMFRGLMSLEQFDVSDAFASSGLPSKGVPTGSTGTTSASIKNPSVAFGGGVNGELLSAFAEAGVKDIRAATLALVPLFGLGLSTSAVAALISISSASLFAQTGNSLTSIGNMFGSLGFALPPSLEDHKEQLLALALSGDVRGFKDLITTVVNSVGGGSIPVIGAPGGGLDTVYTALFMLNYLPKNVSELISKVGSLIFILPGMMAAATSMQFVYLAFFMFSTVLSLYARQKMKDLLSEMAKTLALNSIQLNAMCISYTRQRYEDLARINYKFDSSAYSSSSLPFKLLRKNGIPLRSEEVFMRNLQLPSSSNFVKSDLDRQQRDQFIKRLISNSSGNPSTQTQMNLGMISQIQGQLADASMNITKRLSSRVIHFTDGMRVGTDDKKNPIYTTNIMSPGQYEPHYSIVRHTVNRDGTPCKGTLLTLDGAGSSLPTLRDASKSGATLINRFGMNIADTLNSGGNLVASTLYQTGQHGRQNTRRQHLLLRQHEQLEAKVLNLHGGVELYALEETIPEAQNKIARYHFLMYKMLVVQEVLGEMYENIRNLEVLENIGKELTKLSTLESFTVGGSVKEMMIEKRKSLLASMGYVSEKDLKLRLHNGSCIIVDCMERVQHTFPGAFSGALTNFGVIPPELPEDFVECLQKTGIKAAEEADMAVKEYEKCRNNLQRVSNLKVYRKTPVVSGAMNRVAYSNMEAKLLPERRFMHDNQCTPGGFLNASNTGVQGSSTLPASTLQIKPTRRPNIYSITGVRQVIEQNSDRDGNNASYQVIDLACVNRQSGASTSVTQKKEGILNARKHLFAVVQKNKASANGFLGIPRSKNRCLRGYEHDNTNGMHSY